MSTLHRLHTSECPKVPVASRVMTADARLAGAELRRARLKRRMTIARLAQLVDVDPKTIGRWEKSDYVPDTAEPAIRNLFRDLDENGDGTSPPLREATHAQLLDELARRLETSERRHFPDLPQRDATWYTRDAPSSRRITNSAEPGEPKRSHR